MKNIHILPTEKPSRLFKFANELHLDTIPKEYYKKYQLYITSDEEIKDKCYVLSQISIGALYLDGVINTASMLAEGQWKKVILTTDPDLIADGVQAIDDEFLEWFVKNQCCESVEVEKLLLCTYCGGEYCDNLRCRGYKDSVWYEIIIPQEEPCSFCEGTGQVVSSTTISGFKTCDCINIPQEEPKQETLEEAAERYFKELSPDISFLKAVEFGAKWQAERMFSSLSQLRNELYDKLPTGDVDAFELLKLIKIHLQKLDDLCGNK
jgi:hypothetical protein